MHEPAVSNTVDASALDLQFLTRERQRELNAMRPGDRVSILRRHRLLPLAAQAELTPADSDDALSQVLHSLQQAQISHLVLKGAAHANHLYARASFRPRTDSDLWVPVASVEGASAVLLRLGYRETSVPDDPLAQQKSFAPPVALGKPIDLHIALSNLPEFSLQFSFDRLHSRSIALPRISPMARGLCAVDSILHSTMHYFGHTPAAERPAIWLLDLALTATHLSDEQWSELDRESRACGVASLLAAAIDLSQTWFHCPCPDNLHAAWRGHADDEWRSARLAEQSSVGAELRLAVRAFPDWTSRCRYLWRRAFPGAEFMRNCGALTPGSHLPLAYLKRLFRAARRGRAP